MGLFRKKKEAPSVKMQAPRPKDEDLYRKYLCGYSEECSLCRVRGIYSPSDSRNVYGLCSRHREIYEADMRAIESGKAELPPGLSTESARLFPISGREIWIKQRLLEFMVDEQEITIEKAREQIAIIIEEYNRKNEHEAMIRQKQNDRAMRIGETPKTHLY